MSVIVLSQYIPGSEGCINVWQEPDGRYVAQWGGSPDYDSGYQKHHFTTLRAASDWLEQKS